MASTKAITLNLLLLFLSLFVALVVAELLLRVCYPVADYVAVFPPFLSHHLEPDSTILYGISGSKHFSTDRLGIRKFSNDNPLSYEILFLGGSTTECLYLDDTETWAYLLTHKLKRKGGSIGKSGQTSIEHYMQLKYFTPQLPRLHTVVITCGLNDMLKALADTTLSRSIRAYDQDSLYRYTFTHTTQFTATHSLRLLQLLRNSYRSFFPDTTGQAVQDIQGLCYQQWRSHRTTAPHLITQLPTSYLDRIAEYKSNISEIIALAQQQHLHLIFIGQTSTWSDTIATASRNRLWMGGTGHYQTESGHDYYTTAVLSQLLAEYNRATQDICRSRGIRFIDISHFPPSVLYFYDDCHFSQRGAMALSDSLYYAVKDSI